MSRVKKKRILHFLLLMVIFAIAYYVADTPYRNARELYAAIEAENVEEVRELLESGIDPNVLTGKPSMLDGLLFLSPQRPLTRACFIGNLEIVQLLIDYGATAEPNEDGDWSPLYDTLFWYDPNDLEIVKLLLQNGADRYYEELDNLPIPVFTAANAQVIFDEYNKEAAMGSVEMVKFLLGDDSPNIRASNCGNKTLLIYAALNGNIDLVKYLLAIGCDPTLVDDFGETAYDYAIQYEHYEVAELLQ